MQLGIDEAGSSAGVVFLLGVDNTLLDGDRIVADLRRHLDKELGATGAERYWAIFDNLRAEVGYVDYLGALQRYRHEIEFDTELSGVVQHRLLSTAAFLIDYPFAERLYPRALDVVRHLGRFGPTVILIDGDVVLQPRKLRRSGLWDAVDGRVLIYIHREQMLDAVLRHHPAHHYVMVDDRPRILAAMKAHWPDRLTTILARQGHYALDAVAAAAHPVADFTVQHISELADVDLSPLLDRRVVATPASGVTRAAAVS